jgi:hypothetical protein
MKKIFWGSLIAMVMIFNMSAFAISATTITYDAVGQNNLEESETRAYGLLGTSSLGFTVSGRKMSISGHTSATDVMAQVGVKNLKVQRSSNGTSGWTTEENLGNFLRDDAATHLLSTSYNVVGGYYYRLYATHYAKDYSWPFPKTESSDNWTNATYIG